MSLKGEQNYDENRQYERSRRCAGRKIKYKDADGSCQQKYQNQIANAQKQLQEVSASQEMTSEQKMKKRQEIQQEITSSKVTLLFSVV